MTLRGLLRLVAGFALALFVVASWSTPSEAHAGHGTPVPQAASVPAAMAVAVAPVVEQAVSTATQDCGGHMGKSGSGQSTCCSNTCHAVMSSGLMELRAVEVSLTVLPEPPSPAEVTGPMTHIKRPPRLSAALVG
ncbi:hypothetical protein GCM10008171_17440 [Methylopila jiangsuensis]|jgi:hypothetical protein|uniref:CopL family metal-binding regulatory protein n=1 Tax=Methylopila jiangsuensis TaxID=586230 RepID=A0A9W6JIL7_9HYPH|nr:hypothetical protein [Methylopila jiangsuensis]MDR6287004.1 hypothetical protein [Methylopila jiangsuensis]GLK76490.1 hypothetical protein GCM10008171_17440 [Methylopila jiangsuensis]